MCGWGQYDGPLQLHAGSRRRDRVVEVTAERTALLAESSPTIGQVLPEKQVRDLPLVSTNVLDLMKTMRGRARSGPGDNDDVRRHQHRAWSTRCATASACRKADTPMASAPRLS